MTAQQTPPYPSHWEADVLLRDGRTAHIRPIRSADKDLLVDFYDHRVSDESKYYRFFSPMPHLSARDIARFTEVDHKDRVAFILTLRGRMIAVGRYDVVKPGEAEVAFLVEDDYQGRGIAQILLEHLAQAGRERGVTKFTADVLPDNARMIQTFRDAGYKVASVYEDGVISLQFGIDVTDTAVGRLDRDVPLAERRVVARYGGVEVGDVVAEGVEPDAVSGQAGAGDGDGVEGHDVLNAVCTDVKAPPTACDAN